MQLTSNYNLKKPDGTDVVNITDFNENTDIIDTQLKKLNDGKVEKVTGKQLSTNDYTVAEKTKLAGIATSANNYTHPANHPASIITQDANNRFATDSEKSAWNAKETTTGAQTKADTAESNAKQYTDQHSNDDIAHNRYGTATGTNALVVTLTPAPSKLGAGFALRFKNTTANTGAATLNVNGLGAKPIVKNGGVALSAGDLKASGVYTVCYDGSNFILQGDGGDVGKKFRVGTVPVTGGGQTMSVTVTGLGFTPSTIILTNNGLGYYYHKLYKGRPALDKFTLSTKANGSIETGPWTITSDGFSTNITTTGYVGDVCTYEAYE